MSSKLNIFITGATGYIGGSVLARLLRHADRSNFHITALARSAEKGDKLKSIGVDATVLGSYTDKDLGFLIEAASQADVVFAIVDADNYPAAKAILDGMKIKHEKSGQAPILIHTSGTALIADNALGLHSEHIIYSDLDVEKLNALPISALHRNVDIPIIEADSSGYVKAYLIAPGTIFGYPSGPAVDLGIQNKHSIQMPLFIKPSIARKQGGYFGKGLNHWPLVDVEDTADLFIILFDAIRTKPKSTGHGSEGYYFAENGQYSALEVARAISEKLVDLGVGESREPAAFTAEESEKFFGPIWPFLATNSYARGDRSRSLGWKPMRGKEDFFANIKQEVEEFLSK
ncbi:hypothetical protein M413DRAFT_443806 [Hebeloma cylindrosporum]|uniref:NmrA-like domain-containing protein n=1 Tax=Hebeloma cylindrosporum TaxID=76867 RepID=A0A0C3CFP7_HEBCY|nr:hypothetical protein M413DRAFT_443806 [Hebeloma cylindrosporum h7]